MVQLRYREHFKLDYWQTFYTPYHIMIRDMRMLGLESQIKEAYRAARKPKVKK